MTGYGGEGGGGGGDHDNFKAKAVSWADPVDDSGGGEGGVERRQQSAAEAQKGDVEGKQKQQQLLQQRQQEEDDGARQGFQIGAVHLYKKQVRGGLEGRARVSYNVCICVYTLCVSACVWCVHGFCISLLRSRGL